MTNKEAAQILEREKHRFLNDHVDYVCDSEAYSMAINLLNKQGEPQMVIDISDVTKSGIYAKCPNCNRVVNFAQRYCHNCTQPLEWPVDDILANSEPDDD